MAGIGFLLTTDPDDGPPDLTGRILDWIYRFDGPGSIPDLMNRIRENAAAVRDRLSGDTWQILDRLVPQPEVPTTRRSIAHAHGMMQGLILNLAAFNGLAMENMTRGPGWRFLDSGRRLERGFSMTTLMTAAAFVSGSPTPLLEMILDIADSGIVLRPAAAAARAIDDRRALAETYEALHSASSMAGFDQEQPYGALALELFEELGDREAQSRGLNNLAVLAWFEGRGTEALEMFEGARDAAADVDVLRDLHIEVDALHRREA